MKIDAAKREKSKKRTLLYAWPFVMSVVSGLFIAPLDFHNSPILSLLTPWLALLVFAPFAIVDWQRSRKAAESEKRALQAKYDAEDQAMFGRPLREMEL